MVGVGIGSVRVRAQTPEPAGPTVGIVRPISNQMQVRFYRFSGSRVGSVPVRFNRFGTIIYYFFVQ
jgi:hypothetical protein